jgi:serine/threonine protein kinase
MDPHGEPSGTVDRREPFETEAASQVTPGLAPTVPEATSAYAEHTDETPFTIKLPRRLGEYEILGELGRGGMGVVYKAFHKALNRVVALKTIRTDIDDDAEQLQRFEREMKAAARLQHPNIVPIYEVGHAGKQPFFTMPFLTGGSVAKLRPQLTSDRRAALSLMEKIARAVHHAHEQGVVHRDLKPANVLLDERGEPLVSDFGLAKLHDAAIDLTQTGIILGTPAYMAPEQAAGTSRDIGPHTDVWALGVMAYELLVGRRPFVGESSNDVRQSILSEEPPRLRSLCANVEPALEEIILFCLEKDPEHRCPSALLLADNIAQHLRGEKPTLPTHSVGNRVKGALRRRSVQVGLAMLMAAILSVAVPLSMRDRGEPAPPVDPPAPVAPVVVLPPPTVFIGESGPPTNVRWLIKEKEPIVAPTKPGEPFSFSADGLCVLELGPVPSSARFRLEAKVRHDSGVSGTVGIIATAGEYESDAAAFQLLWKAGFADHGNRSGTAELALLRYQDPPGKIFVHPIKGGDRYFKASSDSPWRDLVLEFSQTGLRATLDGATFETTTHANASLIHAKNVFNLKPRESNRGPILGAYVQYGKGTFKQVVLTPLP